eukprot:scaffold11521_cov68-Phaeocystis_antarctica.AAC.7
MSSLGAKQEQSGVAPAVRGESGSRQPAFGRLSRQACVRLRRRASSRSEGRHQLAMHPACCMHHAPVRLLRARVAEGVGPFTTEPFSAAIAGPNMPPKSTPAAASLVAALPAQPPGSCLQLRGGSLPRLVPAESLTAAAPPARRVAALPAQPPGSCLQFRGGSLAAPSPFSSLAAPRRLPPPRPPPPRLLPEPRPSSLPPRLLPELLPSSPPPPPWMARWMTPATVSATEPMDERYAAGLMRMAARVCRTTGPPSSAAYSVGARKLYEGGIVNKRARDSRARTSMSADWSTPVRRE